ncbi:type II secretion system protein M [Glycocaulis profundi]|nr:type II secretion system protein M [Glycocaulis profundi]
MSGVRTLMAAPGRAWRTRTAREQTLLAGSATVLAAVLGWTLAVQPLLTFRDGAQTRYAAAMAEHLEIHQGLERHRALAATATEYDDRGLPLRAVVAQGAARAGVTLARVLPDESGRLNVWIESADPGALMGWLEALSADSAITATRASIDRAAPGSDQVRAQLLLERPGGGS